MGIFAGLMIEPHDGQKVIREMQQRAASPRALSNLKEKNDKVKSLKKFFSCLEKRDNKQFSKSVFLAVAVIR